MIAYDLECGSGHRFEAWFRSSADYDAQAVRGLLCCVTCGISDVRKAAMAPALHGTYVEQRRGEARPAPVMAPQGDAGNAAKLRALTAAIAAAQAEMLPQSRWVGDDFAREVRAANAKPSSNETGTTALADEKDRNAPSPAPTAPAIHGRATREEVEALIEDGLPVLPLLAPFTPPDRAH